MPWPFECGLLGSSLSHSPDVRNWAAAPSPPPTRHPWHLGTVNRATLRGLTQQGPGGVRGSGRHDRSQPGLSPMPACCERRRAPLPLLPDLLVSTPT